MATTQLVLLGVPAFVGSVTSSTAVEFTLDELVYGTSQSIAVDLAKNTTLPPAQWATGVDVDSMTAASGGWTTIGPTFNRGTYIGGVYLADRLVKTYAPLLVGYPAAPDAIYQHQAVLRANGGGVVTRYHGFKVLVLRAGVGSIVHVAFIRAGSPTPSIATLTTDVPTRWIDLADASICDPEVNGFTTIDASSLAGTVGALFMTAAAISNQVLPMTKYPYGLAW